MKKQIICSFGAMLCALLVVNSVSGNVNNHKRYPVVGRDSSVKKNARAGKPISPDLFGIFFEDLSYAADGGLYAELIQNRSFEYNPADRKGWNSFTGWEYTTEGYGYGTISVETAAPLSVNNPHYVVLNVEEEGREGVGLTNTGFDGIVVRAGEQYNFSAFARQLSDQSIPIQVKLQGKKGTVYGEATFSAQSKDWKKYTATITAAQSDDSARLVIVAKAKGKIALDIISLFPQKTFKNRTNGLRPDIAQAIADLKPKFMRFPGGCLVHGDGIGNIYRWKNTIGPVEQRTEQRNIWNYHQSAGLGYYEYFQFCEDIGAKPVPVLAAAVSCQNSGGTWRIGGTGQRALPMNEMQAYIQDVLDLIEYANGPTSSTWGAKRAQAGHPASFHLQYLGVGNEDKITPGFRERFKMIYDAVSAKHPEITLVGTVGPSPSGQDFELGWEFAGQLAVPVVDEHYYEKPEWFLRNNLRYDTYNRSKSKVYLGEYASQGNALFNALAEAAYMTALERNGDVVKMASYAPLIARQGHTSWNPNLIYFTNTAVTPTVNYYVQQLFSTNQGDRYYSNIVSFTDKKSLKDSTLTASCVKDSKTGDLIVKLVNAGGVARQARVDLTGFKKINPKASRTTLSGTSRAENTLANPHNIVPETSAFAAEKSFVYGVAPYSLTVIRIKTNGDQLKTEIQ
ncbi:alpha-L-arabinofuranosidase C-terminal domain-containing protein [Mucilaginibacter pocheonensis]|uniref:non-reducing end alpha-L-arabinofuranosidase n=1 Tax=Mucilaginibacter pocheonensis TaxID=398050 RepID=A0ABU1TBE6_9SPHI|nr:alpha-L-arabinofuranosidase C-terminal domain-containing protein [Mucilaginibacter pocheonensis]MDR6942604.1 alpha-L-arabinofuranosidase [Mucilaginibacter pocheonensis]